ncbi:tubulin polyglutamylase TTLL4-like isoform X2 [Tribolium madens]|uniref:tubulin polyglutamylase TTLL4-like isoform X2 n=1 Tax=Tribolium madens TaxID=41895 RepID=UPI001CF75061|nr:tubulin polyglutamylase TTLL4-like isoform X2 [Tribolium madens]
MGDCHLNYPPSEEKFCKYSYSSWCPTCERNSPRRRSRSETISECRRKCKEMKSLSPKKYVRSREYENMDLELNYNFYEPPRENYKTRSSQLCELPTSYISNNCQTSKLLPTEFVDKNAKSYEPSLKMKQEDFYDVFKYEKPKHLNAFAKKPHKELPRSPYTVYDNHLSFDTSTYFDKIRDASNLHERYIKEIESVRERIALWKAGKKLEVEVKPQKCLPVHNNQKFHESKLEQKYVKELEAVKQRLALKSVNKSDVDDIITISQSEIGPRPRKIAIKTKKVNLSKIKKVRLPSSKIAGNAPISEFTESDYSGSDESEAEEVLNADDESESPSEATCNGTEPEIIIPQIPEGGDASGWPLRPSLFPHIPPYIRFSTHDADSPIQVPAGRRLFKWKLSTITPAVVRKTLTNSGFALVRKSNQWLGTWGKHMKSPMFKTLKETQKLNHFPGTFQLGRKDRLWRNFQRFINKFGYKEFGFIPQTYVLPHELKILKQNWEYKNGGGEAWIVKPPASARGAGIKVINKWSQLPKKMSLVVQKYISNPYLINGSKFDLRLYVLVTSFNPLRIYLYPDGLARFASAKYSSDSKDLKDRYVHLTNYSINKLSSQYTANEDANACQGHNWTITKLLEYMSKQGIDTKALWRNLQQLVIKTIITGEAPIHQLCEENMLSRYNCYELFGVDVLLDENLKAWLLEVNISPSLHSASPLDAHVKGPLVQMLFDLAQFHLPPRLSQTVRQSPQCFEPKLYTTALTKKEREKHTLFEQYESRHDYLDDILTELTGDDVRKLTQAEDEFTVKGRFERIFPTSQTHKYLSFMEVRYYNRLFDAWESKFEKNRQEGINLLRALCAEKVHLKVAPQSTLNKARNFVLATLQSVCSQCRKFAEYDPWVCESATVEGRSESAARRNITRGQNRKP